MYPSAYEEIAGFSWNDGIRPTTNHEYHAHTSYHVGQVVNWYGRDLIVLFTGTEFEWARGYDGTVFVLLGRVDYDKKLASLIVVTKDPADQAN